MQLTQRLSKASTVFYRYAYRRVSVDEATLEDLTLADQSALAAGARRHRLLRLDSRPPRRSGRSRTRASTTRVDIGLAEHFFGSQLNFARFLVRNATYHPIGKKVVWRAAPRSATSTRSTIAAIR